MIGLGVGLVIRPIMVIMKTFVLVVLNFISSLNWHILKNYQENFILNTIFNCVAMTDDRLH